MPYANALAASLRQMAPQKKRLHFALWDAACLTLTLTLVFTVAWECCLFDPPLSLTPSFYNWLTFNGLIDAFFLVDVVVRTCARLRAWRRASSAKVHVRGRPHYSLLPAPFVIRV